MDPMVGSGGKEENSNSNVISLLDVCCLCNRRFLYDSLDLKGPSVAVGTDDHTLKEEDLLFNVFFEDSGSFEKSLLQLCQSCKALCHSLMETKEKLSKIIDEIGRHIRRSKKLLSCSSHLVSKLRVVTRLFQDQSVRTTATTYLSGISGIETSDFTSPTKEDLSNSATGDEFINRRFGNLTPTDKTSPSDSINKTFSFLSPVRISPPSASNNLQNKNTTGTTSKIKVKRMTKTNSKGDKKEKFSGGNSMTLVSNSVGRFVLVQEHEENARDVGDSSDNNSHNLLAGLAKQALLLESSEEGQFMSAESTEGDDGGHNAQEEIVLNFEAVVPTSNKHKESPKHVCPICSKSCVRKRDLVNHVESHSKIKPFICEICGVSYRHKRGLEAHVAIHKGEGKHRCPHCNQMFTQKAGLKRHLPLHTGESRFQCDQCGKSFVHHSSFAHHKMVHNGERRFVCEVCTVAFTSSTHLKRHERIHTGERPYSCNVCDKPFNEKSNLKTHMRTHTKEVAHPCPHCPKGFSRKHQLQRHIDTFHPKDELVNIEDDFEHNPNPPEEEILS